MCKTQWEMGNVQDTMGNGKFIEKWYCEMRNND